MPAKPKPRLPAITDDKLTDRQKELMEAIRSGPRGRVSQGGPFGVYLHAPDFGDLTQKLGAHCRYKSGLAPRLSEFAILCTARQWRARGMRYIAIGMENILAPAAREYLTAARQA